ncbi:putative diacylglycerol O-acyltransferase Mb3761c [Rhipicephalus microplus]|uniref:putative diacylglycerol O-acyltransferase Mb3761c n=1 Tax=Rhipicephalus microplus TaxID=6941 RepID=UPI003F6B8D5A
MEDGRPPPYSSRGSVADHRQVIIDLDQGAIGAGVGSRTCKSVPSQQPLQQQQQQQSQQQTEPPVVTPRYMRSAPIKLLTHPVDRNLTWYFVASIAFVSVCAIIGLPLVLLLLSLLPVAVVLRHAGTSCASAREGVLCEDDKRFVSPMDTYWLHDTEFNFHVAHCVLYLEPGLTASLLSQLIVERILDKTNDEGKRIFRRFTRKVIPVVGGFTWVEDDSFRIENHVLEDNRAVKDSAQLRHYLMALMSRGMNVNRPLWDVHVLPNYDRGRETVLIARVHQVISDGVSLMMLFCNHLCDPGPSLKLKPRFGGSSFPLNVCRALVVGPLTFLISWLLLTKRDFNYLKRGSKPPGRQRVIAWTAGNIRLSQVYRIKQITRSTFNDVLMTAMSGSLRSFFKRRGVVNPPDIKVCLAVDLRYEPATGEPVPELGTQLSSALVRLPTNTEGAIPRLWEVRQAMDELKNSPDPVVLYGAANILFTLLPCRLAHWFMGMWHRKPSAVFCNVPGPEEPVVLGMTRVKSAVAWAGWTPEVPLAVTITSYAGAFNVAVSSQMDIVPDPDEIIREFANQLDHLSDLLSRRRIPGEHRRRSSYTAERRNQEIARPPLHELQQKLQSVQDELQRVRHALDELRVRSIATPASGDGVAPFGDLPPASEPEEGPLAAQPPCSPAPPVTTPEEEERERLEARLGELQEEFSELLIGLRRRKSVADNVLLDTNIEEDDDLDGELRRPQRRRALSVTVRRASLQAVVSTTRPLTTGSSPVFRSADPSPGAPETRSFLGVTIRDD